MGGLLIGDCLDGETSNIIRAGIVFVMWKGLCGAEKGVRGERRAERQRTWRRLFMS